PAFVDVVERQQLIEQQARSGIMVAVDEADFWPREIPEGLDAERIAARNDQPHLARDEADDAILARIEPFACGLDALRPQLAARQMQPGEVARALRERNQRILVADIAQVDADTRLAGEEFAQFCHCEAMARMHADHRRPLFKEGLDLTG